MNFLALLMPVLLSTATPANRFSIDLNQAQLLFHEAGALSAKDGGRLWGRPLYGPMLFVDPETRQVVANRPDAQGLLQQQGGLYTGLLPKEVGIANTAMDWGGVRWTMIMWPLPEHGETRGLLMMHECFHRIQPEIPSGPGSGLPANHLATLEGRIWLQLEWRALEEALLTKGPKQVRAVRDALLFRNRRQGHWPGAAVSEQSLELNEGLAEYTGIIAHAYSAGRAMADGVAGLRNGASKANFARSFAYSSGPAYGLLLDQRAPGWRKNLGTTSDLGSLLWSAFSLRRPADPGKEADRNASRYGGDILRRDETRKESERAQRRSLLRTRLAEGPILQFPTLGRARYTFNPNGAEPLDGLGTAFTSGTVSDDWGKLEAPDGYLAVSEGGNITGFQVSAPSDTKHRPLAGQGWSLTLNPGWVLSEGPRKGDWLIQEETKAK